MVLSAVALSPFAAHGQNSTWQIAPPGNNFNDSANWTAGVPTDTATFGATGIANIDISGGSATLNTFQFNAGAPAYSFTASSTLQFQGSGIVNNSSNTPTITSDFSLVQFSRSSSAGNATLIVNGAITFADQSTAGSAAINVNAGGFTLSFTDDASAGNSTITVGSGSLAQFSTNASGGTARIINSGGTVAISSLNSGMSVGSIEGSGTFTLGGNQLTVGGNNLSTSVSGVINLQRRLSRQGRQRDADAERRQ